MGDDFQPRFSIQHSVGSQLTQFMHQSSVALALDIISSSHLRLAGTFLWVSCLRSTGKLCLLGDGLLENVLFSAVGSQWIYTHASTEPFLSNFTHFSARVGPWMFQVVASAEECKKLYSYWETTSKTISYLWRMHRWSVATRSCVHLRMLGDFHAFST